jgi:hypothetical protein
MPIPDGAVDNHIKLRHYHLFIICSQAFDSLVCGYQYLAQGIQVLKLSICLWTIFIAQK